MSEPSGGLMETTEREELLQLCQKYLREMRMPLPLPTNREEAKRYEEVLESLEASEDAEDAWFELDHLTFEEPDTAWELIRELVARTADEDDLATLGAGVLETFIHNHGNDWAETIENEMRGSRRLVTAMQMVRGIDEHPQLKQRISHFFGE